MAGHRRAEATPFFERLCPAMTASVRLLAMMDDKAGIPATFISAMTYDVSFVTER